MATITKKTEVKGKEIEKPQKRAKYGFMKKEFNYSKSIWNDDLKK